MSAAPPHQVHAYSTTERPRCAVAAALWQHIASGMGTGGFISLQGQVRDEGLRPAFLPFGSPSPQEPKSTAADDAR